MSPDSAVIILTGASRGLGLAVLRILLTQHNARVTTLSRSLTSEFQAVVKDHGDRVVAIQGDVGDVETNARAVRETVDKWGGLDGLILNAGAVEPLGNQRRILHPTAKKKCNTQQPSRTSPSTKPPTTSGRTSSPYSTSFNPPFPISGSRKGGSSWSPQARRLVAIRHGDCTLWSRLG